MTKCIFCENDLDDRTKPEHILLNALGGRKTTTKVDCSDCNNIFGSTIDKAITDQLPQIRNLLQLHSGTGKLPPGLKNVQTKDGSINVAGDGSLSISAKPFEIIKRDNGEVELKINAASLDEIENLIPNIAGAIKMPEAELREQLSKSSAKHVQKRPGVVHFPLQFGGPDALRSATKSCLVLWALVVGNDEIKGSAYDAARNFVLKGDLDFNAKKCHLDSRIINKINHVINKYSPIFNLIYVASNADGRVVGHFTLYNLIGFHVVLAESGGLPNQKTALISDALDPRTWSADAADELEISFEWLDSPDYSDNLERSRARITAIMKLYSERTTPVEVGRITDEIFEKHGFKDNDPIPPEKFDEIVKEISHRLALHMLSIPYEQEITAEEMKARFSKKPDDGSI